MLRAKTSNLKLKTKKANGITSAVEPWREHHPFPLSASQEWKLFRYPKHCWILKLSREFFKCWTFLSVWHFHYQTIGKNIPSMQKKTVTTRTTCSMCIMEQPSSEWKTMWACKAVDVHFVYTNSCKIYFKQIYRCGCNQRLLTIYRCFKKTGY